jgi:Fis family transcriptional regulator
MKKGDQGVLSENEIARYVRRSLNEYFKDLDGEDPSCPVYDMVIDCVEKPLIETVLHHAGGNQTRAAELLGLNRNTLRKKIQTHKIKL